VVPPPTPAALDQAPAPRPNWFDDLVEMSAHALPPAPPSAEAAGEARASDEPAAIPVAADGEVEGAVARATEREEPETDHAPEDEPPCIADPMPAAEIPVRDVPGTVVAPSVAGPPLDLDLVVRSFARYGPLLSRDRLVVVDWVPGPDANVVCVAPRDLPRGRVVRLAGCLMPVVEAAEARSTAGPIRRLSLLGADGVVVLTPLNGAVLVAAARRPGALALLEALSARVVPGRGGSEAAAPASDAAPAAVDASVAGAVRVAVPGATLDVITPAGIAAASVGGLAGRLLDAIAADGGGPDALHALSVDLDTFRLMVHPVDPNSSPPRFVAVVGGPERPGLLGRRTERAARALREAS
jgi:hypothetical protein